MKTRLVLAAFAVLLSSSLRAQPEPSYNGNGNPIWTSANIWSRNMELVKSLRVNTPTGTDGTGVAEYIHMFEQNGHAYLCDASNEWVWVEDITDPRNPFTPVLIKAKYTDVNGVTQNVSFHQNVHWVDTHPSGSGALAGHAFAVVGCGDVNIHHTIGSDPNSDHARFLIFDLTAALAHVAQYGSSTYNTIDIDDAKGRSSAHLDAGPNSSVMTEKVYIGYIEQDNSAYGGPNSISWHTEYIWCERMEGIFIVPSNPFKKCGGTYAGYADLHMLGTMYNSSNWNSPTGLVVPTRITRLTMDCNGKSWNMPIELTGINRDRTSGPRIVKEARGYIRKKLDANGYPMTGCTNSSDCYYLNQIDLQVSHYGRNTLTRNHFVRELLGPSSQYLDPDSAIDQFPGGCLELTVDFSTPNDAKYVDKNGNTTTTPTAISDWIFDADRSQPSNLVSSTTGTSGEPWSYQGVHTFDEIWLDNKNQLFLTSNEMAGGTWNPNDRSYGLDGVNYPTATTWSLTPYPSLNPTYYTHLEDPTSYVQTSTYPNPMEDHRLLGNYLRIWHTTQDQRTIIGTGSNNGPAGSYDPLQLSVADYNAGKHSVLANAAISGITDGIAPTDCSIINTSRAPYTMHRPKTFYGETNVVPSGAAAKEVYMAGYTQGVRVIDLSNFITPGQVPTNTTQAVIERAYFDWIPTLNYNINDANYFYARSLPISAAYYYGSYDATPDVRATPIHSDENFVYTQGINDPQRSPLLQNGGIMILRYFRDQIGGTIRGYARNTTDANDNASTADPITLAKDYEMSYREVNLQGTFAVARPTAIAQGCTVHVLDGSTFNEVATNGIEVDGTLSVETTSENNRATFNVPIHVINGGTLIMQSNSHAEFTNAITVDPGGTLKIKDNTKTVFNYSVVNCNGFFDVFGLSGKMAEIDGAVSSTDRTVVTGSCAIKMLGRGNPFNESICSIHYGTFNNVCMSARDIWPNSPTVSYSAFHYNLTKVWTEFRFERDALLPGAHSAFVVSVSNSSFDATNGPPIEQDGIAINGPYVRAQISSCTFDNLESGIYVDGPTITHIQGNTVTNTVGAIAVYFSNPLICSNTCSDDEFCLDVIFCMSPVVYDNSFTRTAAGTMNQASGTTYYRGNMFDTYCDGIVTYSGIAQMAGIPFGVLLGRNQFTQAAGYFGTYGCGDFDVWLNATSKLDVHCGHNLFSSLSILQVFGNPAPAFSFDATTNNWQDPNCLTVRTNMYWTGTDLCNSETLAPVCAYLPSLDGCTAGGGGGGGWGTGTNGKVTDGGSAPTTSAFWPEADTTGDTLEADYNFRLGAMFDTTATLTTRRTSAIEAFEAARLIDSGQLYSQLIGTFNALAIDPTADNDLKATALALRGMTFEVLGSIDLARGMYASICSEYPLTSDSIPAAWRLQYLAAVADTVNVDSLLLVFQSRQFADIIRLIPIADTSGGPAHKIAVQHIASNTDLEMTVHPNPATNLTRICVPDLPAGTQVTLIVVNEAGEIVSTLYNATPDAELGLCCTLDCSMLPNGTYFARLWNDILGQSVKLSVQH